MNAYMPMSIALEAQQFSWQFAVKMGMVPTEWRHQRHTADGLATECGELLRIYHNQDQVTGFSGQGPSGKARERIAVELADVWIYSLQIASFIGFEALADGSYCGNFVSKFNARMTYQEACKQDKRLPSGSHFQARVVQAMTIDALLIVDAYKKAEVRGLTAPNSIPHHIDIHLGNLIRGAVVLGQAAEVLIQDAIHQKFEIVRGRMQGEDWTSRGDNPPTNGD